MSGSNVAKYDETKKYDEPLYKNPTSTQELLPIKSIDESGVFEHNDSRYSRVFVLSDINFVGLTDEEQKSLITALSRAYNTFSCRFAITVANEYVGLDGINNGLVYQHKNDGLDALREGFNKIVNDKVSTARQGLYQKIYLTTTIKANSIAEARTELNSIEGALRPIFAQLGGFETQGCQINGLNCNERMQMIYNFTHPGQHDYAFDISKEIASGHDWRNIIAPAHAEFYNDYFKLNGKYGRVIYISGYSQVIESEIIKALADISCNSYISINNEILNKNALIEKMKLKYFQVITKTDNEKKELRRKHDFLTDVSEGLVAQKKALDEMKKEINSGDEHFFNTTILFMYMADSLQDLNDLAVKVEAVAKNKNITIEPCFAMQRQGLNSAYPFGVQEFKRVTNFSSSRLAMFMPFKTQDIRDDGGIYYGINQLSQNPIIADRKKLQNYNGLIFGKSGSGKGVYTKCELLNTYLTNSNDQVIIIDPKGEYVKIAGAVGGEVLTFSSKQALFINPLDVDFNGITYADLPNVISAKSDFLLALLAKCMRRDLDTEEAGVIDKATEKVFSENYAMRRRLNGLDEVTSEFEVPEYLKSAHAAKIEKIDMSNADQIKTYSPTLQDVYQVLCDDDSNPIARKLANQMRIFVDGSLNLFNHKTNVDIDSRFLVLDLSDSGLTTMRDTIMLVMLQIVRDKLKANFARGMWTYIYIDEFHNLIAVDAVAQYVIKLFKEVRHEHGVLTGITQDMSDLYSRASETNLNAILSNSEYIVMLNQSPSNVTLLKQFLPNISKQLFSFVSDAPKGKGLLHLGSITVPFDIEMGHDNIIYELVNTDK